MDTDPPQTPETPEKGGERVDYSKLKLAILVVATFTCVAWLVGFYILNPERPLGYWILRAVHQIDPPKRFALTAAPTGEFLSADELHDRYASLTSAELAKVNGELAHNYLHNFEDASALVPYVVGRYVIVEVRELTSSDLFTSGIVVLSIAVGNRTLLLEHVYPADPQMLPAMKQTLHTRLGMTLDNMHDMSAVIHVEQLADGQIMVTAMPLLYGQYTAAKIGTFTLQPPATVNLRAGWPLFKERVKND
jgi:hypothetical protein